MTGELNTEIKPIKDVLAEHSNLTFFLSWSKVLLGADLRQILYE